MKTDTGYSRDVNENPETKSDGYELGKLDFLRRQSHTQYRWGGPFNGQRFRQLVFFDILYYCSIHAIVETGTFRGATTSLFAATALPVYSVEVNPRYFAYAKMRFILDQDTVHLYQGDSRSFLRDLGEDSSVPKKGVFFYLDAHGGKDSPLLDELEIVFSQWANPIVMVDDFRVPDSDYGFDDYGPGKALDQSYIAPAVSVHHLSVFFPAAGPMQETGARRGSVVLGKRISDAELSQVKTLVRSTPNP